ncbi:MAG: ribonuclease HII [Candidatus Fluviicola riflensis]|nr:MAG: ribonuclease HII [Candidatus Fluviicola riflensis]OGS76897.1 MAG: ribonuclease HII [Candidatus Fluviicola riflensis]OGS81826.1 MAG: ribonuclease HII [Fluviicola sp. RIFCSPHIGHO2_01_FULL_43_53]OGS88626.1 MAG: ribonuclease HII [Fluviicola sp. RIFCSPHIGHO2_12_FULL_43_24]
MAELLPFRTPGIVEAGCDEAGRGCLAGPVVAAAVILPSGFSHPLLNDSKKLTTKQRDLLRPIIEEVAISYQVCFVSEREIESINILQASLTAMYRAAAELQPMPHELLIDGNHLLKNGSFTAHAIIKGDEIYQSIAAASILAKTYRDEYMERLHEQFPMYQWIENKGYPTVSHRKAIQEFGSCEHHRQTFNLLGSEQLMLQLD